MTFGAAEIYRCSACLRNLDDQDARRVQWSQLRPCCRQCASEHGCTDPDHRCHQLTIVEPWQTTTHGEFEPTEPLDRKALGYSGAFDWNDLNGGDAA